MKNVVLWKGKQIMSRTVSPGLSRVSHWAAVSCQVAENLKNKLEISKGTLFAIEQYFEAALAGALEKIPQGMPTMKAVSCFSIAVPILEVLHPEGVTQRFVQEEMAKYLEMIRRLKEGGLERMKSPSQNTDITSLIGFFEEMEEQGNVEREGRLFMPSDY